MPEDYRVLPERKVSTAKMPVDPTAGQIHPALTAFARLTAAFESAASIDDLLRVVGQEVGALVGVRRFRVSLRDEVGLFRGCVGQDGEKSIDVSVKRTLAGLPADGLTLELLATRRPVIVANAQADPRLVKSTVRYWNIRSMMAVPMIYGGEVIGIIELDDVERPYAFTAGDAELASVFAHHAAAAVEQMQAKFELRAKVDAAQRQVDALRRCAAVDGRLSDLLLAGASLQGLVAALAKLVGKPCAVYDAEDVRLAAAPPCEAADGLLPRLLERPCVDRPDVRAALSGSEPGRPFLVGPLPNAGVLHRYLVAPVTVDGATAGRLVVMENQRRFTGGDMLTMRRAATVLALQMSAQRRASEADWDAGASLAGELLGGSTDREVVQRRAERLGVSVEAPRVVALIGSRTDEAASRDFRAALAAFSEVAPEVAVLATSVAGGIAALLSVDAQDDSALLAQARDVVLQVCRQLPTSADVVVGLSSVRSSPEGYAEAYGEAREVVECIRRFAPGPGPDIFSAAELGAGRVLLATSEREAVRKLSEATFGNLVRDPSKADLLVTLRSFFDNMASIRSCALRLGVHENTIRYRLARIEELTGLPVTRDPDAQLRARLSLLVLMLEGRLPATTEVPRAPARLVVTPLRAVAVASAG